MIESSDAIAADAAVFGARGAIDVAGLADLWLVEEIVKRIRGEVTRHRVFGNDARTDAAGERKGAKGVGDEQVREPDVRGQKVGTHVRKDVAQIEHVAAANKADVDELEDRIGRFEHVVRDRFDAAVLTQGIVQKGTEKQRQQ
jgi:hypothetical protein